MNTRTAQRNGPAAAALVFILALLQLTFTPRAAAAVAIQDPLVTGNIGGVNGGDVAINGSVAFTVTSGASVLVVQYGQFGQTNTQMTNTTVKWNGVPLTMATGVVTTTSTYFYSEIYYLFNPTPGTGNVAVTTTGRSVELGIFTLSGVNTAAAPIANSATSATGTTLGVTLNSLPALAFAVVEESNRQGGTGGSISLAATAGTSAQQWSGQLPAGDIGVEGGGTVSGIPAGSVTITATYNNTSGNRQAIAAAAFSPLSAGPPPTISNIAPASGEGLDGTTTVTVTGTNFLNTPPPIVTLKAPSGTGINATSPSVTWNSATSITFTVPRPSPAAYLGTADVTVTNNDGGSVTSTAAYTYTAAVAPTITGIAPANGTAQFQTLTINGTGFLNTPVPTVQFFMPSGQTSTFVASSSVTYVNSTQITARIPLPNPGTFQGAADITVINVDGQSTTLSGTSLAPQGFSYVAAAVPTVTGIAPSAGVLGGANVVTISGTGFEPGATVTIGGTAATAIVINSNTSITATVPAGAVGAVNVVVTNPDTQSGTLTNGYTYIAPPTYTPVGTNVIGFGTGNGNAPAFLFNAASQSVTLNANANNPTGTIFYTTNGTAPATTQTGSTLQYTGPFNVSAYTVVESIVVVNGAGSTAAIQVFAPYLAASASPVQTTPGALNYVFNNVNGLAPYSTTAANQTNTGIVYAASPDVLTNFVADRTTAFAPGTTIPANGLLGDGTMLNGRLASAGNNNGANGLGASAFQARFTGIFTAPSTGIYTLATGTDDGSQMSIDGVFVVANNVGQGVTRKLGQIGLLAGQHTIQVDYTNTGGGFGMEMAWDPTGNNNNNPGGLVNIPNANLGVQSKLAAGITFAPVQTSFTITGGVASTGTTVNGGLANGTPTNFTNQISPGDTIIAGAQSQVVTAVNSANQLTTFAAFAPALTASTALTVVRGTVAPIMGSGSIASSGTTVTGTSTNFTAQFNVGDTIVANGQPQVVTAIASATSLTTLYAFNPALAASTPFTVIRAPITPIAGTGTISSAGTTVTGVGSAFTTQLVIGDIILAGTQSQVVTAIGSATSLTTAAAFNGTLAVNTKFNIIRGTSAASNPNGTGTLTSSGSTVTGAGTNFLNQLRVGDTIISAGQTQLVTAIGGSTSLTTAGTFTPALAGSSFTVLRGTTFGGTSIQAALNQSTSLSGAAPSGSFIFYTTDGSTPAFDAGFNPLGSTTIYTSAFAIASPGPTTVKAVAAGPGYLASTVVSQTFTNNAPTVAAISPALGTPAGGQAVTITGANFSPTVTSVTIGGVAATNVVVVNSTTITAATPAYGGTIGVPVDVIVANNDAQSNAAGNQLYTFTGPPTIASISPISGSSVGGTSFALTGTNFAPGFAVAFNGNPATNLSYVNTTTVIGTTPPSTVFTAVDVSYTGQDTRFVTAPGLYTYTQAPAPTVFAVSPTVGPGGGGTAITITGINFAAGASVKIGGASATSVVVVNASSITAVTPAGSVGIKNVVVTNADGQSGTLVGGFAYLAGDVISLNFNGSGNNGGQTVPLSPGDLVGAPSVARTNWNNVNGTNGGSNGPANNLFDSAGISVGLTANWTVNENYNVNNVTNDPNPNVRMMRSYIDNTNTTTWSMMVNNVPFGLYDIYIYSQTDNTDPTRNGTFKLVSTSPQVTNTYNKINYVFNTANTTFVEASADGTVTGNYSVFRGVQSTTTANVTNGFQIDVTAVGSRMSMQGMQIVGHGIQVAGVNAPGGPVSTATAVTIKGAGFVNGPSLAVTFGGAAATNVTFVDANTITATTPDTISTPGPVNVVLTNGDNIYTGTLPNGFVFLGAPPTISSISPAHGATIGGTTVNVVGTNFLPGIALTLNGVAATVTNVTATTITATTGAAGGAGSGNVAVQNVGDSVVSGPPTFTYTAVSTPVFSVNGGLFTPAQQPVGVTITSPLGTTYYTLDGSTPTAASAQYTGAINVPASGYPGTTLKAITINAQGDAGSVATSAPFYLERMPENPAFSQLGLYRRYYEGSTGNGTLPIFTTIQPFSSALQNSFQPFIAAGNAPANPFDVATAGQTDWAVQWTGYVTVAADGVWTFYTNSDDGSALYIGNTLVVNNNFSQGATERNGSIVLKAGAHLIKVQYAQGGGGYVCNVRYSGPGQAKIDIPDSQFSVDSAPTVSSVSPSSGSMAGFTAVTITGTNFGDIAQFGDNPILPAVMFNGVAATNVVVVNSTTITALTPAMSTSGPVTVAVQTGTGPSGSQAGAFTYTAPQVITWTGTTSTNWSVATNWDLNRVPQTGDAVVLTVGAPNPPSNLDEAGLLLYSLRFDSSTTTPITVAPSGGATGIALIGVAPGASITIDPAAANHLFAGGIALNSNASIVVGAGRTFTVSGMVTGTSSLSLSGGGTLALSNIASTYTGATTITASTLIVSSVAADGVSSSIGAASAASSNLVLSSGTLKFAGTSGATNRGLTLINANNTIDVGANTLALSGSIVGSGSFTKNGAGTLTLSNALNVYASTTMNAGALISTGPGTLGLGTATVDNDATLILGTAASLSGFGGNGSSWTQNGGANLIANNAVTLTDGNNGETRSVFYNTLVPNIASGFSATFTYTPSGNRGADGTAFVIQTTGPTALGGGGGSFGYAGITPSFAVELNIYTGAAGGIGMSYGLNGSIPTNTSVAPVNLASGNDILVTVTYDGTNMVTTLSESTTTHTFTLSAPINLTAQLAGATSAYVGFTGATGGVNSIQVVKNFALVPTVPLVLPVANYGTNLQLNNTAKVSFAATAATPTVQLGNLTIGANAVISFGADLTTPVNQAYNLIAGATALSGPASAINIANNGTGTGTLTLGALSDSGTAGTLAVNAGGATSGTINLAATGALTSATNVSIGGGTVILGATSALGPQPKVTLAAAATLDGNGQTFDGTIRGFGTIKNSLSSFGTIWPGAATVTSGLTSNENLNGDSLNLNPGGKLNIVMVNSNSKNQSLTLTGSLNLAGLSTLSLAFDAPLTVPKQYTIVTTAPGGISNAFNTVLAGSMNYGSDFDVIYTDGTTPTVSPASGASVSPPANQIIVRFNSTSVTPVKLDAFAVTADGSGALISWTSISEFQNAGFNVYRRNSKFKIQDSKLTGAWARVNTALIGGRITSADAKTYRVYDWAAPGAYEYKLESVSVRGVNETYAKTAAVVVEASGAELSDAGMDAALSSVSNAADLKRAESLSAMFAPEPRTPVSGQADEPQNNEPRPQGNGNAARAFDAHGKLALPAASVRALNRNDAEVGQSSKPAPSNGANLDGLGVPSYAAGARWFTTGTSKSGSYTGAKVTYSAPGVLLIPQAMLPAGFNASRASITREGRPLTALAVTSNGLVVFAPGYQDQYTDKDALFLRSINGATSAGQILHASGLFAGAHAVNTDSPATVTASYHDVYFDYNYRPYTFEPWFSSQYLTSGTVQSFSISTPNASNGAASLTVNLWSLTESDHALQVLVNGQPAGQATWSGGNAMMQITFQIASGVLNNGANQIDLVTPALNGVPSQISFLHSMTIGYTKSLNGSAPLDVYNLSALSKLFEISHVPSASAWIVDARYADRATLVAYESQAQADGSYTLRFNAPAGGTGHYIVVPAGQENLPIAVSKRSVKPVKATTYMAVGPAQFSAAVQPLLMQRAKEGLRGAFVDQEQIFDYYNYGRYGAAGIQSAVRAVRPQYLLLLGRTTYDYLNYSGLGVDPLCPTFLVSTTFWAQATSDSMFGDLGRGYPEVAVGRLPVNNASELSNAVTHVLNNSGLSTGYRVHAAADRADPDAGDFAAEADAIAQAHPDVAWQPNYLGVTYQTSPEVTAALTQAANGGADLLMYVGHGNAVRLGNEVPRILDNTSVSAWTGYAVFLQSTCTANWMAKDESGYQSIAIQALTQPQGGISASIASSTYMNSQNATEFMSQLLTNAGTTQRWGNALLKTQQWAYAKGSGYYIDLGKTEQIFGDPAMPVMSSPSKAGAQKIAPAPAAGNF